MTTTTSIQNPADLAARTKALRNHYRRTPWHMDDRAIAQEIQNLRELVALGVGDNGDRDRIADLRDEQAWRIEHPMPTYDTTVFAGYVTIDGVDVLVPRNMVRRAAS